MYATLQEVFIWHSTINTSAHSMRLKGMDKPSGSLLDEPFWGDMTLKEQHKKHIIFIKTSFLLSKQSILSKLR